MYYRNFEEELRCKKDRLKHSRVCVRLLHVMSGLDRFSLFPCPRQEFVETVGGVSVDHALKDVGEVCVRLDVIELRGFDQRTQDRPAITSAVAAREEMVLAAESHGTNGALDGVGVELYAAIVEEADQSLPARWRVADGLGERASAGEVRKLCLQPCAQIGDHWLRSSPPRRKPVGWRLSADFRLDGIQAANTAQRFFRDRRSRRFLDVMELAPCVRPAGSQNDVALAVSCSNIAIDMQHALEVLEMGQWTLGLTIRREHVDCRRRRLAIPAALVADVGPQPPGLGASAAGIKHRDRRVVGKR